MFFEVVTLWDAFISKLKHHGAIASAAGRSGRFDIRAGVDSGQPGAPALVVLVFSVTTAAWIGL